MIKHIIAIHFFGNKKCVETNYILDNKIGGNKGSEIIEI